MGKLGCLCSVNEFHGNHVAFSFGPFLETDSGFKDNFVPQADPNYWKRLLALTSSLARSVSAICKQFSNGNETPVFGGDMGMLACNVKAECLLQTKAHWSKPAANLYPRI